MLKAVFIKIFLCVMLPAGYYAKASQTDVFNYYKQVNLAELAICDSNFSQAAAYYAAAFAINPTKPFYKDLSNAMSVAMDMEEYLLAEKYLSQILNIGIDTIDLAEMRSAYTVAQLAKLEDMLGRHKNNTLTNNVLVKSIWDMVVIDQKVRAYYSALYHGAYMVDSVYTIDYMNAAHLLKLFKEKGIPSQAVLKASHSYILLVHNAAASFGGRPAHLFDDILYDAIFTFDYDARSFINILEQSPAASSYKRGGVELIFPLNIQGCFYKNNIYPEYYDYASENRINEQRAKLGLETLDDLRKKIITSNKCNDSNSVWRKYQLRQYMSVRDVDTKGDLDNWLAVNGKDAVKKRSVYDIKFSAPKPEAFEVGSIGSQYVIGKTTYTERMKYYQCGFGNTPGANTGYEGTVVYQDFNRKDPPFGWNYKAEVLENPAANLAIDSNRYNKARFVPGYKMLIESGYTFYFGRVDNIQMILGEKEGILIRFAANVDTGFYKRAIRYIGTPTSYTVKRDTVAYPLDKKYVITLLTRTYSWVSGTIKTEIVLTERVTGNGKKIKEAVCYMTDIPKYGVYMNKLAEEKKTLDKKYTLTRN